MTDADLRPMSFAEVAALAGMSTSTVRRAVNAGRLVKVPGTHLIVRWSVEQWLTGGYDADSDGQGEGPGDGGPDHAITDRTAPLAGRGHDERERPDRPTQRACRHAFVAVCDYGWHHRRVR